MEKNIAIIGGGISGLTAARLLSGKANVTVFEKESRPGGLIKCTRPEGSLFHTCGGHVFNSRRQDVLDFFWNFFERDKEFVKADRHSAVYFSTELIVPYPVENHIYYFNDEIVRKIISDIGGMFTSHAEPENFRQFLLDRFGKTLYDLYFGSYNRKIWRCDLAEVSLAWLEGKLPMPTPEEIIFNNIKKVEEKQFIHSSFWYEKEGGSQLIADRFAETLNIRLSSVVDSLERTADGWSVNGDIFDIVIFCGNIRDLPAILKGDKAIEPYIDLIEALKYHGTTSVFCEIDRNPYSWIYLPDSSYDAHRIICTGNFSQTNNAASISRTTGTIEFTDFPGEEEIYKQLKLIPFNPRYIDKKVNRFTYPIQDSHTRGMIASLKKNMSVDDFFITGRFADWEYYNMDAAIGAAIDVCAEIEKVITKV